MQADNEVNDSCNGINGDNKKSNSDDNCSTESKTTVVNNDTSIPSTKVDVEPINNKDGDERTSERTCDVDDVVTSPPIKLRIRQSFHDGTLDDGINNGASAKVTNDSTTKSVVEQDASIKSEDVPKESNDKDTKSNADEKKIDEEDKMDVDLEADVKTQNDTLKLDESIKIPANTELPADVSTEISSELSKSSVDSPKNDVESPVIRPTKTKGNIKKLMQKKRDLDSPPVIQPAATSSASSSGDWKYCLGDLLWGKVSGHPWWPCLVAEDPFDKAHHKLAKRNKCKMYHVQYFGNEGERGWITETAAIEFKGKTEFMAYCQKMISKNKKDRDKYTIKSNRRKAWDFAVSSAMQALPMDPDDRIQNFAFVYTPLPAMVEKAKTSQKRPRSPCVLPASKRNKRCSSSVGAFDADRDATQFSVFVRVRRNELFHQGVLNSIEEVGDDKDEEIMQKLRLDWKDMHSSEKSRFIPMGVNSPVTVASSAKTPSRTELKTESKTPKIKTEKNAKESKPKGRPRKEVNGNSVKNGKVINSTPKKTPKSKYKTSKSSQIRKSVDSGQSSDSDDSSLMSLVSAKTTKVKEPAILEVFRLNHRKNYAQQPICNTCEKLSRSAEDVFYTCQQCNVSYHKSCQTDGNVVVANDRVKFTCSQCVKGEHSCFSCKKIDGSTEKCRVRGCHHFFHRKCILQLRNASCIDLDMLPQKRSYNHNNNNGIGHTSNNNNNTTAKKKKISTANAKSTAITTKSSVDDTPDTPSVAPDTVSDAVDTTSDAIDTPTTATATTDDDDGADTPDDLESPISEDSDKEVSEIMAVAPAPSQGSTGANSLGFMCPQHTCQNCEAEADDNETMAKAIVKLNLANKSYQKEKFFRCIRCPNAFHTGDFCISAGSEQIENSCYVICSEHFQPLKTHNHHSHINVSWCFACSTGGSLLCCESCPAAFHATCLNSAVNMSNSFFCDACEAGKRPTYGSLIWVKVGSFRWWPCQIYHTRNVPKNILDKPHQIGEFPVFFFGTNDFFWSHRARIFMFDENDKVKSDCNSKKSLDTNYRQAVIETLNAFKLVKDFHKNRLDMIKEKSERKPAAFRSIKVNYPIGNVQIIKDITNHPVCECSKKIEFLAEKGLKPCDEKSECINRLMLYECSPINCHADCTNQRILKRQNVSAVPVKSSDGRGWGLQATQDITKGTFTFEYVGDLIDEEETKRRMKHYSDNFINDFYMLTLDSKRVIDAGPKGNLSRFMNHSCKPNCETQKWHVNGDIRIGIFALQDIKSGSELTFNYNFDTWGDNSKTECKCGADTCSGYLGIPPKLDAKKDKVDGDRKKEPKKKIKKKKEKIRAIKDDICYRCKGSGELLMCDRKMCPRSYHLSCLGVAKIPNYDWLCPWHHCDECGKKSTHRCVKCPNSFCMDHAVSSIFISPHGLVCMEHDLTGVDTDSKVMPPISPRLSTMFARNPSSPASPCSVVSQHSTVADDPDNTKVKLKVAKKKMSATAQPGPSKKAKLAKVDTEPMYDEDSEDLDRQLVIDFPI